MVIEGPFGGAGYAVLSNVVIYIDRWHNECYDCCDYTCEVLDSCHLFGYRGYGTKLRESKMGKETDKRTVLTNVRSAEASVDRGQDCCGVEAHAKGRSSKQVPVQSTDTTCTGGASGGVLAREASCAIISPGMILIRVLGRAGKGEDDVRL